MYLPTQRPLCFSIFNPKIKSLKCSLFMGISTHGQLTLSQLQTSRRASAYEQGVDSCEGTGGTDTVGGEGPAFA